MLNAVKMRGLGVGLAAVRRAEAEADERDEASQTPPITYRYLRVHPATSSLVVFRRPCIVLTVVDTRYVFILQSDIDRISSHTAVSLPSLKHTYTVPII